MEHKHQCAICPYSTNTLQLYRKHAKVHSSEKPFKCPESICPYRSKWERSVKSHVQNVHFQSRLFPCSHPGCSHAAKQKGDLTQHYKIHSGEKSLICSHPSCLFSTNYKQSLIAHTRAHTGENPFVCQFESCSFASATSGQLVIHTRTHTKEKPYKCPQPNCEYSSAHNSALTQHQLIQHPKVGEERPSFKCPLCAYSTKRKGDFSEHVTSHTLEKLFKCDEPHCNYEGRTTKDTKQHKRSRHSDEKPFACSVESCEYLCKSKGNLSAHFKMHTDDKPYKCELCPYRAKVRQSVRTHIQQIHLDPNFRPFKCTESYCEFTAKSKSNLNYHLLIHKGDRKFSCSFPNCDYRGIRKSHIESHEYNIHRMEQKLAAGSPAAENQKLAA